MIFEGPHGTSISSSLVSSTSSVAPGSGGISGQIGQVPPAKRMLRTRGSRLVVPKPAIQRFERAAIFWNSSGCFSA